MKSKKLKPYKVCTKCDSHIKRENFYKDKQFADGYKNMCKQCCKMKKNQYVKENRPKLNAYFSKRRADKLQQTPKWLTKEQKQEIEEIYLLAQEMTKQNGIQYEVDHIIPLNGKKARGLHVPWNLQILTKEQNSSKSNKL